MNCSLLRVPNVVFLSSAVSAIPGPSRSAPSSWEVVGPTASSGRNCRTSFFHRLTQTGCVHATLAGSNDPIGQAILGEAFWHQTVLQLISKQVKMPFDEIFSQMLAKHAHAVLLKGPNASEDVCEVSLHVSWCNIDDMVFKLSKKSVNPAGTLHVVKPNLHPFQVLHILFRLGASCVRLLGLGRMLRVQFVVLKTIFCYAKL